MSDRCQMCRVETTEFRLHHPHDRDCVERDGCVCDNRVCEEHCWECHG